MDAILFDLDGVFYLGDQPVKGAAEVADWVRTNNIPHLFVTNTSSRPRSALLEKLKSFGIHTDASHIFTPPVAAINWLHKQTDTQKIALFVPQPTLTEFNGFSIWKESENAQGVTAIVVGDLGEKWSFQALNSAFRLLMESPKPNLIALGMTRYWQAEDGLRLDVAPFITALEYASDTQAIVMGKPAISFYQAAINLLGVSADNTVMLGDDIRGDVEGAKNAGLKGVLVKTGKYRSADLQLGIQPDALLESIRDFPAWWQGQEKHL